MTIPDDLLSGAVTLIIPAIFGWVWKVQTQVTEHAGKLEKLDEVIEKLDELVTLLLQDRLSKK